MNATPMNAAVVTGTSTGIGRACALALVARGWHVFAGVRRDDDGASLLRDAAKGPGRLTPIIVDLADASTIHEAYRRVSKDLDAGLAGLVNNAGTTQPCPFEYLPLDDFRFQLEVNLTGHLEMVQAFLPLLKTGRGRIVNITSVGGKMGGPLMAAYSAAKHGMEGVSDTLRFELRSSGIRVCVVEPGLVSTAMRGKLERDTEATLASLPPEGRSRYGDSLGQMATNISREAANGSPPEVVAGVVVRALTSRNPRVRYPAGKAAGRILFLRRVLPDAWMDRFFLRAVGLH